MGARGARGVDGGWWEPVAPTGWAAMGNDGFSDVIICQNYVSIFGSVACGDRWPTGGGFGAFISDAVKTAMNCDLHAVTTVPVCKDSLRGPGYDVPLFEANTHVLAWRGVKTELVSAATGMGIILPLRAIGSRAY